MTPTSLVTTVIVGASLDLIVMATGVTTTVFSLILTTGTVSSTVKSMLGGVWIVGCPASSGGSSAASTGVVPMPTSLGNHDPSGNF